MERSIGVAPDVRLWVEEVGAATNPPLLLVMGANASALTWPEALVDRLAEHHRVVRYDHRDTGRSTSTFDERPYALTDLAADAVAVLDVLGIERAHLVGMSIGGTLVQLLLLDHPGRHDNLAAHARAEQSGLERGGELGGVRTRTLVIDAPLDPIAGTAHARHLAASIPGSRLVTIPGMGHAIPDTVVDPLASAILEHTRR